MKKENPSLQGEERKKGPTDNKVFLCAGREKKPTKKKGSCDDMGQSEKKPRKGTRGGGGDGPKCPSKGHVRPRGEKRRAVPGGGGSMSERGERGHERLSNLWEGERFGREDRKAREASKEQTGEGCIGKRKRRRTCPK